jgi:hypothetical protein
MKTKVQPVFVAPDESFDIIMARFVAVRALAITVPVDIMCSRCDRRLAVASAYSHIPDKMQDRLTLLDEADDCRWCARPITAAGEARAPLEGFIRAARGAMRELAAFHPAEPGAA